MLWCLVLRAMVNTVDILIVWRRKFRRASVRRMVGHTSNSLVSGSLVDKKESSKGWREATMS